MPTPPLPAVKPFDFSRLRQRTLKTFMRFATPAVLRKVVPSADYDPATGQAAQTTTDHDIFVVPPEDLRHSIAAGGDLVVDDDLSVTIHASVLPDGVSLAIGDRLLFASFVLTIKDLSAEPAHDPVVFQAQIG